MAMRSRTLHKFCEWSRKSGDVSSSSVEFPGVRIQITCGRSPSDICRCQVRNDKDLLQRPATTMSDCNVALLPYLVCAVLALSWQTFSHPSLHQSNMVVGLALRDLHALPLSAIGVRGVGPVFRVDDQGQDARRTHVGSPQVGARFLQRPRETASDVNMRNCVWLVLHGDRREPQKFVSSGNIRCSARHPWPWRSSDGDG